MFSEISNLENLSKQEFIQPSDCFKYFSNVYGKNGRAEFDNGTLIFQASLFNVDKSEIENFFATLHPSDKFIAIGNPFNLLFSKSLLDMENHRGWLEEEDKVFYTYCIKMISRFL